MAVLVLSIGFLGVGAMLAMSLSTNNSSMGRSMATIASYSILDSMRADLNSALSGAYNKTVKADSCKSGVAGLPGVQLDAWCSELAGSLGAVATTTGKVACTNVGDCTITVTFDDSRNDANGTATTIVTKARL